MMAQKYAILCPGGKVTGGPEVLHQLGHAMRSFGLEVSMTYFPFDRNFESPGPYTKYHVPTISYSAAASRTLILPETYTGLTRYIHSPDIYIWWLSVDNFISLPEFRGIRHELLSVFAPSKAVLEAANRRVSLKKMKSFTHFAQSQYASNFLYENGLSAKMLTDYISDEHVGRHRSGTTERLNRICYNPKKGIEVTRDLQVRFPQFEFLALEDMTSAEVRRALELSKLYIDFGNHPGKDRLPREAALAGCCVITGRRGSAGWHEDVPIPDALKLDDDAQDFAEEFRGLVEEIFLNYDRFVAGLESYRAAIKAEKNHFFEQVKVIFDG